MKLFVTGIGTEVGKTVCSALLVEYFKADYWKPVQSGDLDNSDTMKIKSWTSFTNSHPEAYRFKLAASPHQSAREENVTIELNKFVLPETQNPLIIEGAGGLMVPLNNDTFMLDLIEKLKVPVALVVRNYLGCINHSLLSMMALESKNIKIKYLVLNGNFPEDTENLLCNFAKNEIKIIKIPEIGVINKQTIIDAAKHLEIRNN